MVARSLHGRTLLLGSLVVLFITILATPMLLLAQGPQPTPNPIPVSSGVSLTDLKLTIPVTYQVGMWPTMPTHPAYVPAVASLLILNSEPQVTMIGAWTAQITFTTAISTSAATVFYGTFDPYAVLPRVRYLAALRENLVGESTQHSVTIPISPTLTSAANDFIQMGPRSGGIVAYRIELNAPKARQNEILGTEAFDRRFEFYNGTLVPTVTEGPFVDQITPTSAIISWDTDQPVNGAVKLAGKSDIQATTTNVTHFEVPLTGLAAGSTYTYSVQITDGTNTTATRQYTFITPQPHTTKFDFVAMGDGRASPGGSEYNYNGVNYSVVRQLFTSAFNRNAAFVVFSGDYAWGYTTNPLDLQMQLRSFKDAIEQVRHYIPLYTAMGNHELSIRGYMDTNILSQPPKPPVDPDNIGPYVLLFDNEAPNSGENIFANEFVNPTNGPVPVTPPNMPIAKSMPPYQENVYSFDYGNSRFVVLNTAYWYSSLAEKYGGYLYGYIADDQAAWLVNEFNRTKTDSSIDHLFLIGHTPFFPTSGHITGGMWLSGGSPAKNGGTDRTYVVERRDQVWQAFVNSGKAVAYLASDEHNYSRTFATKDRNGKGYANPAWQIVTGGAGAPLVANPVSTLVPWSQDVKMLTPQLHYVLLKVDGKQVTAQVYSVDDQLIESIVLKTNEGVVAVPVP